MFKPKTPAIIFCLFFLISNSTNAQNYFVPEKTPVPSGIKNELGLYGPDGIYILGWSKKGCIAYAMYTNLYDGIGQCTDFRFYIQDLRTDKILWKYKTAKDSQPSYTFKQIWKKVYPAVYKQLIKYNIAITKHAAALKQFPAIYNKDTITVKDKRTYIKEHGENKIKTYQIFTASAKNGKKKIFQVENPKYSCFKISGYFKNPYENRIAVVVTRCQPAFEGSIDTDYILIGADISKGFK